MKTIKDSIHDHIEIDGVALDLLDSPPVQRLRHIKQLGTVHLVYPSANHTRFEHSLGVFALANEALDQLGIDGPAAEHLRAAAILHDVGHPPYSHNVERVLERPTVEGTSHEERAQELVTDEEIARILDSYGLEPDRVAALVTGDGRYGPIISGDLDVDRMDYLVRDAHHTGVPYGTIDHGRLIRELAFDDGDLVLREGNVQTAENMLIARALMNQTVYNHHVARISKTMLDRAVERLLEDGLAVDDLWRMDDPALLAALREHEPTADLVRRITHRDLYKRAVWTDFDAVPVDIETADHDEIREYEAAIASDAGIDRHAVIVDRQSPPSMPELSTMVTDHGDVMRLEEASGLVGALRDTQHERRRFGIYTPETFLDPVGSAAERILGLDIEGDLVRKRRGRIPPLDTYGDE